MFQGSRHVKSGDHFALLQGHGASLNATTSFDRTNYFESMPAGALDLGLWLEADRMAYLDDVLTQENFRNQVDVVAQERSQRMDNVPYGTVFEKILPLVFDAEHPYGHLPIGNMQHLSEATLDEVSAFHARYYMPSNAVLSIVGDVETDEAFAKAEKYFGHIDAGQPPKREIPPTLASGGRSASDSTSSRTSRHRRSGSPLGFHSTRRTGATSPRPSWQRASSVKARRAGCIGGSSARSRSR